MHSSISDRVYLYLKLHHNTMLTLQRTDLPPSGMASKYVHTFDVPNKPLLMLDTDRKTVTELNGLKNGTQPELKSQNGDEHRAEWPAVAVPAPAKLKEKREQMKAG